jgi:hypothetical protein
MHRKLAITSNIYAYIPCDQAATTEDILALFQGMFPFPVQFSPRWKDDPRVLDFNHYGYAKVSTQDHASVVIAVLKADEFSHFDQRHYLRIRIDGQQSFVAKAMIDYLTKNKVGYYGSNSKFFIDASTGKMCSDLRKEGDLIHISLGEALSWAQQASPALDIPDKAGNQWDIREAKTLFDTHCHAITILKDNQIYMDYTASPDFMQGNIF